MKYIIYALNICFLMATCALAGLVIDQTADQRVDDRTSDGTGSHKVGTNRLLGYHTTVQNMHVVYVFQMSGLTDPTSITSADFSATQASVNSLFNIDAHIIRYDASPAFLVSDYETSDTLLMDDFSDNSNTGSKSLHAEARATLGAQLKDNWVDGNYVFIGLKTDPFTVESSSNQYVTFGADAQLTIYCGDEVIEEPKLTDLEEVLALGNLTNAPAVYTTNGIATNVNCVGSIQSIMYEGQDYTGMPTRVWAYIGLPEGASVENPVPAVVLAHGGGGTAFSDWVEKWNERGYAAIAMDNEGRMSGDTHAWSGPQRTGIYNDMGNAITDQFMYHATADAILANSLLRSLPEVNSEQVGMAGVSWGGVITSTTIGLDDRFVFAVPTYGCGHLYDTSSHWRGSLENNDTYKTVWDPVLRLSNATLPVMWFSYPQETTFPMDSFAFNYHAMSHPHSVSLVPGMGHGHGAMWMRPESYDFADNVLGYGTGWCEQQSLSLTGSAIEVVFSTTRALKSASLVYAEGTGNAGNLTWLETNVNAWVESPVGTWTVTADLPDDATAWFVNVTAEANVSGYRGGDVIASSDYQEVIHLIPSPSDQLEISHPVFTNETSATITLSFTAPTYVRVSDIQVSNQSHAGAFSTLTAAPLLLEEAAPASTELLIEFDNLVAGLTNGQSATATLTMTWTELDGSTDQVELPLQAQIWGSLSDTYDQWAFTNGLSGAEADQTANPDADQLNNFAEYAFGGDPTDPEDEGYVLSSATEMEGGAIFFDVIYARRTTAGNELVYTLESCSNVCSNDWGEADAIEQPLTEQIDTDFESVTNRMSIANKTNEFIRLTVSELREEN